MSADQTEKENKNGVSKSGQETQLKKELILKKLKEKGCRITRQRLILLDVILKEECSCCKEIYYQAVKEDDSIGPATVYRMVNTLEEIGVISRRNMYKITDGESHRSEEAFRIELSDDTTCHLSAQMWKRVIREGLRVCGYIEDQEIRKVTAISCDSEETGG